MSQSGLLEITHDKLFWPDPSQVLTPSGIGPRIYAQLAQEKIGKAIALECPESVGLRVGILTPNSEGDGTEAPLAVVCDFNRPVSETTLRKVYTLAWSFSRAQALITLEPHLLRVWTCCEEPPLPENREALNPVTVVKKDDLIAVSEASLVQQAATSLYWVELVSGQFFQQHAERFRKQRAADQMLLGNLKSVRRQLKALHLHEDIIHDLLARLIFIQFLFHRKDSSGKSALDEKFLNDLYKKNILSREYHNLSEILTNHTDTYALFRLLNGKFNGDLFPGKCATDAEREQEWQKEERQVEEQHLRKLAEFVSGDLRMDDGQRCLWPLYSFDAVPLDFISSIYEEFVSDQRKTGAHYTPGHIVDFILDGVLPWNDTQWNIRILDPSCGSGIFLVKAFQRLIYRWKIAHPNEEITSKTLKSILEHSVFGADINPHAVRVASFSLYLTMCDAIDPRHYWKTVKFPRLRDQNLLNTDFFREDMQGIQTDNDADSYDLVVGNAPWGRNSMTPAAHEWAQKKQWEITYGNIGPLFLPKAAALVNRNGQISMMQPAGILLFSQKEAAKKFRAKFFSSFTINEIVNLSALRFGLFKNSISPSCIITSANICSDDTPLSYICPKPMRNHEDDYRVMIEPHDVHEVSLYEAINVPLVWTALMWGSRRDFVLIQKLKLQENICKFEGQGVAFKRQGIIRTDRMKRQETIIGRRILETQKFPKDTFLFLDAEKLPLNKDPLTHSRDSTDYKAFGTPQMIIKQSFQQDTKRFQAVLIRTAKDEGILCSTGYVSVHVSTQYQPILEVACLTYNSMLAVYYLLLSSGSFASYIPKINVEDLLEVPIPQCYPDILPGIQTFDDIDQRIRQVFSLKDSEWTLIEDLFNYTLPDFKGDSSSPGRQRTHRQDENENSEPELQAYCEYFMRVLKAGFGQDKQIGAVIFQELTIAYLPVRLVAFYLNQPVYDGITIEPLDSPTLLKRLDILNKTFIDQGHKEGIFYQRVARIYSSTLMQGREVPTIYFVKPDKIRYWTRSMGLRDADEVAADMMQWRESHTQEEEPEPQE